MRVAVMGYGRQAKRYLDARNGLGVCTDDLVPLPKGVVIATAPRNHFYTVEKMLKASMPCLCEKPLAETLREVEFLCSLAAMTQLPLMVAHTLLFSRRFAELQELAAKAQHIAVDIGGPRPKGHDYSAALDWGPHAHSVGVALKAQAITFGDYPKRRAIVTLDGQPYSLDTRGETDPTPMATQMRVFLDLIGGKSDWRADVGFTLAVYESLFGSDSDNARQATS